MYNEVETLRVDFLAKQKTLSLRVSITWLYAQIVKKMRQLIISNVAQIVIKKHKKKRKRSFVYTDNDTGIVSSAMVHPCASIKGEEGLVGYVKALLLRHQNHQRNHHWLDSLITRNLVLGQW